jgi:UDP:flavonoid glycosyltransferase YjiC (YdhE family)
MTAPERNSPRVVMISPPFYSHFHPMLALGKAFWAAGAQVTVACSQPFQRVVETAGLDFWEIEISRNANTGIVQKTGQEQAEADRLAAFVEATKLGPVATLTFQAHHRKADMLADPFTLQQKIARLAAQLAPDLFVVDQLSYGVTLSLHGLELPYLTFCPGHPTYIPTGEQRFGVPYAWPSGFQPEEAELRALNILADEVDDRFTHIFNQSLHQLNPKLPRVESAFRLSSPLAVLFNYPDFGHLHHDAEGPQKIFMGACFEPQPLDSEWRRLLEQHADRLKLLVSLGTFLSARSDVLERLILTISKHYPDTVLYIAAGASIEKLAYLASDSVILAEFLPQTGLLPHIDGVIHHAGNNSFTETLYYGKPAVLLPFSSDQFSIAHDAEQQGLGVVVDPNHFLEDQLVAAVDWVRRSDTKVTLQEWGKSRSKQGAFVAAELVLRELAASTILAEK